MGRDTAVTEYSWSDGVRSTVYAKTADYDADSNVTSDQITTLRTNGDTYVQDDTYTYNVFNGTYGTLTDTTITEVSINGGTATGSEMQNVDGWGGNGALMADGTQYTPNTADPGTVYGTAFNYSPWGTLTSATVTAGTDYTNNYVSNFDGEILSNISTADPASEYYFFNGTQEGVVTNNGTTNVDYAQSIAEQVAVQGSGYFANGATTGTPYAAFGTDTTQINALGANATAPSYTVQSGDTLESIAQYLWGDSSYWYLLADANGISSDSQLYAGETLTVPTLANNDQNNASTNTVYNATQALGDVSPTHPVLSENPIWTESGRNGDANRRERDKKQAFHAPRLRANWANLWPGTDGCGRNCNIRHIP